MESIKDDIKNENFSRVYLICGEEAFLRQSGKKRLSDAVVPPGDTMNRAVFSGKDVQEKAIMELSETLPFMSARRLILVEDSGFFKKAAMDELSEYMSHIPEETVIVFCESEVDKRGKLYKAVKKAGKIISCDKKDEETLRTWVAGYLLKNGRKIRKSTASLLIERAGTDMFMLKNEMDKLISFCGSREEIGDEDVMTACSLNITSSIFAMISDIAEGRQKKALERYYELVLLRESPMKILLLISREFNMLLTAKEMKEKHAGYKEMAAVMKVPEFAVRKYVAASERFTRSRIIEAISDCVNTDNDIKKGKISDRIGTELLIVKYSGSGRGGSDA